MTTEDTTQTLPPEQPRRLYRSRDDRMLGGVAGGIAKYFNIDAVIVRILAVVLLFVAGASAIAYLAALVFVPNEPLDGEAPPESALKNTKPLTIAAIVIAVIVVSPLLIGLGLAAAAIGIPLAFIALGGLFTWWLVSGEGPGEGAGEITKRSALGVAVLAGCFAIFIGGAWAAGVGGGTVAAVTVIVAGTVLVVSAFTGGLRLLILPTLALAIGVGFVSAAGIDLDGGVGKREYNPTSASDIRDRYELGVGQLTVDLRGADLPQGDTPLNLRLGVGDALVLVPRDVCVASEADLGMGAINVFDRENGGVDLDWEDRPVGPAGAKRVVVDADVGVGAFEIQHERSDRFSEHHHDEDDDRGNFGCEPGPGSEA